MDDVNRSEDPPFQEAAREVMWVFGGYDSTHDAHDGTFARAALLASFDSLL